MVVVFGFELSIDPLSLWASHDDFLFILSGPKHSLRGLTNLQTVSKIRGPNTAGPGVSTGKTVRFVVGLWFSGGVVPPALV